MENMTVKIDETRMEVQIVVNGTAIPQTLNQAQFVYEQLGHQIDRLRNMMYKGQRTGQLRALKRKEMDKSQQIKYDFYGEKVWVPATEEEAANHEEYEWQS